jgi:hypothetical protein
MSRYTIRRMERSDHPKVAALQKKYLGTERDDAFYEWKYWQNPAGPHMCVVAEDNETGDIVGQIGSIPLYFQFFGQHLRGYYEGDIIIEAGPDRGKLFFKTYRKRAELVAQEDERLIYFNYAITIPKTLKITTRLWKVKPVAPIPKLIRILRHEKYLRVKYGCPPVLDRIVGLPLNVLKGLRHPLAAPRGIDVERVDAFDESADRLWERTRNDYNVWTARNSAFLNWRYVAIPHFKNTIFTAREGDEIRGYIIVICVDTDMRRGYIQDFHFERGRDDAGRALLNRAVEFVRDSGGTAVVSWTFPHCTGYPVLRKFGFVSREYTGRTFVLRPAVELKNPYDAVPFEETLRKENWHICKGDDDWEM